MAKTSVTFEDVRRLAHALPEVDDGWFGAGRTSRTFEVRGKGFARFGGRINGLDDGAAADTLVIRISEEQRRALLTTFPDKFFITPHYEKGGAVLVRLSSLRRRDLPEVADLLEDAWRRFAPKRLVNALDEGDV